MKHLWSCMLCLSAVAGCASSKTQVQPVPYMYWESSSVNSNNIRIHYWRTGGTGKPP